jgi:hypothetical protein
MSSDEPFIETDVASKPLADLRDSERSKLLSVQDLSTLEASILSSSEMSIVQNRELLEKASQLSKPVAEALNALPHDEAIMRASIIWGLLTSVVDVSYFMIWQVRGLP